MCIRDSYKGASGVIIVFDITNRESFDQIDTFYNEAQESVVSCHFLIVGTHSDLAHERKVSAEEALFKANQYGMRYIEVSSKTGQGVSQAFEILNSDILGITTYHPTPKPAPVPSVPPTLSVPSPPEPTSPLEETKEDISFLKKKINTYRKSD
eukprot:TRINITY_DN4483_c0_g1_i1.p1 TRINITY_DN4483_c0_g1~~TRINITY_DN4483_c0_g1_i1.p1  ORF type:complete len:153 (+),score=17.08 TRINITY_DN4483_c0_g1_i1:171-629(+)